MDSETEAILREFVAESLEHLSDVEGQLLTIEEKGENLDAELVNTVFRAMHSIKGTAGLLGFHTISRLAHQLENILNLIRNREMIPTSPVIDALLSASDALRGLLANASTSNDFDIGGHLAALSAVLESGLEPAPGEPSQEAIAEATPAAGLAAEVIEQAKATARDQGMFLYLLRLDLVRDAVARGRTSAELIRFLESIGQILASDLPLDKLPNPVGPEQTTLPLDVILGTVIDPSLLPGVLEIPQDRVREIALAAASHPAASLPTAPEASGEKARPQLTPNEPPADSTLRVPVSLVEMLMRLAGELVLSRNQLMQSVSRSDWPSVESATQRLDVVTSQLQEVITRARMQPVGNIFGKFPRLVRDMAKNLGKRVNLRIEGKEAEVDKSILEAMVDPLTHLVRNAIDHGIETPEERQILGKSPVGSIALRAFHQAGQVIIQITDDGAGIDAERLRARAVERGLVPPARLAEMSREEILELILLPGLSLAKVVTDVSGRGVGMDVVKTNLARVGGEIDIQSDPQRGTTITLRLPLTLAIIPSLTVRSGGDFFAIPQVNIAELVRVRPGEASHRISLLGGSEVLELRGQSVPLVRLSEVLDLESGASRSHALQIAVVETEHLRFGLAVDELQVFQEIVVKPLGHILRRCACFAGATVMGDGRVALILDMAGVARRAQLRAVDSTPAPRPDSEVESAGEQLTLLLFRSGRDQHFAVPLQQVTRIERIRSSEIQRVGDRHVLPWHGGVLEILSLDAVARPHAPDRLFVMVFTVDGHDLGLGATEVLDVREVEGPIDAETLRERGISGSVLIDGAVTRIIDVHEIAQDSPFRRGDERRGDETHMQTEAT
jgi:two-component system chemotaxis sensor kinase CheA